MAGRLSGRTSNDIKNFLNTHLRKKMISQREEARAKEQKAIESKKIIRPQPRTFSKNLCWTLKRKTTIKADNYIHARDNLNKMVSTTIQAPPQGGDENETLWWDNMIADVEINDHTSWSIGHDWDEKITPGIQLLMVTVLFKKAKVIGVTFLLIIMWMFGTF
ncbi:hypothetical protein ACSBR1_009926 [Camellia fascicularis]